MRIGFVGLLERGDVEKLLGAEVVVDHALRRARLGGDLVDPGPGEAPVGELLGRHGKNLQLGALGVALAALVVVASAASPALRHTSLPTVNYLVRCRQALNETAY